EAAVGDESDSVGQAAIDFDIGDDALALGDGIIDAKLTESQHSHANAEDLAGAKVTVRHGSQLQIFVEGFHAEAFSGAALLLSLADQGWGWRASMKAKTVIKIASSPNALSRTTVQPVSFSGVPKQPQLMSMCSA